MHNVAIVALDNVVPLDLVIPSGVFGRACAPGKGPLYDVRVCGTAGRIRSGHFDLRLKWRLDVIGDAGTVIVPGIENVDIPVPDRVIAELRAAARRGARIASICSGAFVLAAAGLLDGRRATTHWRAAPVLAARYPYVSVDPNVLFVDQGQILTSAGATAGFDLCLHMLRTDHGAAVANESARLAVMPPERNGGQAQFIDRPPPSSSENLAPLLLWLEANLHRSLTLDEMARQAVMAPRTFSRHFRQQTGTTALQWLMVARVRRAQSLLETSDLSVEQVATLSGFESAPNFRDRFRHTVGVSPSAYRRAFGAC